jgi:hypothetical protein
MRLPAITALAVLLLFPIAKLPAQDFTYTNNNGAITITGYTGPGGDVNIPGTIDGLPVTSIGPSAFMSQSSVSNVSIPNSVANIGDDAFAFCGGLTNASIPDGVTYLGDEAFFACSSLVSLTIGLGITTIGGGGERLKYGTFQGCTSLTRLMIPDNVTNISNGSLHLGGALGAFYFCSSLTNVTIGKGLAFLGVGAFSWCTNLVGVYFQGNAPTPGQNMFGEDIFHNADLATLYYLQGSTGWSAMYAGRPTVLWNPTVQSNDASFGVRQNRFGFNITGTPDIPLVIEAATNLAAQSWVPLQSSTLTNGLIYFSDSQWANYPGRLYRIRSP